MRKLCLIAGAAMVAAGMLVFPVTLGVIVAAAAVAAETAPAVPAVVIPWGEYVIELAHIAAAVGVALIPFAVALLPMPVRLFVAAIGGETLIRNSMNWGINAVEGAAKDKALSVPIANQVLRESVAYAVKEGAPWLVKLLGGPEGIRLKVFRALHLDEDATAAKLVPAAAARR